jgi:hypothetical protein
MCSPRYSTLSPTPTLHRRARRVVGEELAGRPLDAR